MSESRPEYRKRSIWKWAFSGGFAVSVLINLALAAKIVVFNSNYPIRPICHGGRHIGLVVLNEPMNKRFKDEMQHSFWNSRISQDDILYISYWEWRYEKEDIWNTSRTIAEYIYAQNKGIKRMSDETREKLQTARCKFIRKWALRKSKSQ